MRKTILLLFILGYHAGIQAQDLKRLHEMGKNYLIDGDYSNAESLLSQAHRLDSNFLPAAKDLTLCYFFQKDYKSALKTIQPYIDRDSADDQCYQIAGNLYKSLSQPIECELILKKGIQKFQDNGPLYNALGELYSDQKKPEAIGFWEKGIQNDPA